MPDSHSSLDTESQLNPLAAVESEIISDDNPQQLHALTCTPTGNGEVPLDVNLVSGSTSTVFTIIEGQFDDVSPPVPSEGDYASVRINNQRALHVNLRSGSAETGVTALPIKNRMVLQGANYPTSAKIAGTALTGSYQTVMTNSSALRIIFLLNSCNQTILISFSGGLNHFELEPGESIVIDLGTSGMNHASNIQAKHNGVVPTAGTLRIGGAYVSGE